MQEVEKYFDNIADKNESENNYAMLFKNMVNGFARHKIVTDKDGKAIDYIFLEVNDAFEEMIGQKREKIINRKVTEVLPGIEKDSADWISKYGEVALTGKSIKFEQFAELLNRWYQISAYSTTKGYFNVVVDDVSERKLFEESLKKSSDYYKHLIDSLDELVFIVSKSGKFVYVNKKTVDICGCSYEEMMDSYITKYLAKESIKEALFALAQEFMGHNHNCMEVVIVTKTGEKRIVQISSGSVMVREGKKIIGLMINGHDITERKKRDEEMAFLASLPQENPNPVIRIAENGVVDYQNKAATELFYLDGEGAVQMLDEMWRKVVADAIGKKIIIRGEREIGERYFAYSIVPVKDRGYANIYALDITDRKEEEEAKMAEKQKAEKYLNVAAVIIIAIDKNQNITLINKKGREILGYAKEEIVGKNWFDNFLEKQDIGKIKTVFNDMMDGKAELVRYHENYIITKSGEKKLIAWNNTVLFDDNGALVGTLSSGEDISDRKVAEEKLQNLAKEWSATFDSMTDGISLFDKDKIIVNVNKALCGMLGKTKEEMINKKCYEVFKCLADNQDKCPLKNTVENNFKKIEVFDDKLKKWLFISTSSIYSENGILDKTIHVVRDITERKKFEEETRKRNMELEKFNSLMIGREEKMIQLKKQMKELEQENSRIKDEKKQA